MSRRHSISHLLKYWGTILKRLSIYPALCIELINLIYLGKLILSHTKHIRVFSYGSCTYAVIGTKKITDTKSGARASDTNYWYAEKTY